ncbi:MULTISPECIES: siderophore ABC transporter substrate-binding protein [Paracoccus]|uniref:Iron complex transport system substrate-binding protein n=1 Tax=Paracoccus versutus TaxID=34007 RepID=A0A3D9XRM9_PARVE|nr:MULTISPECIES: ABC transporter substrate-binding protein [Paracoccus]REF69569.1 iron complex transport system substrate-binding protein [Paracoccus versutus]WGR58055.1 iron ABC transporter substrate-binding protein [Paracoccus versutus]
MFGRLIAATATALVLGAAAWAQPMTIAHSQGETVLPAPPEKVLILDINALDIAHALGAQPAGVLGSNLPDYLQDYADPLPKVGTIFEPDYEAIAASDAALMIVGTRTAPAYAEMSRILPTVDLSLGDDLFTSVRGNVETLGRIFGKPEQAARMVEALDAKIAHLKEIAPKAGTALILVTNGGKLGAYGPKSRVGWIHSQLGFATVAPDIDDRFHGGDVISFEYILERDPDWIFVIDRDAGVGEAGAGARAALDNPLMARTRAVRDGHVVHLDPHAAYIAFGGYTALNRLLDQLTEALAARS